MLHVKLLEKQSKQNPKQAEGEKYLIKIRAEISEIDTKKKKYKE
jgi:hypothetical protein